jgi:glycosyltransferase involved in cell wall biosynthesis
VISIIMPVYNGEKYLRATVESILAQSEPDWELIVVNDGSDDRSEEIILSYADSRIRYFKQANLGTSAARNRGLELAAGEFIVFHDADDLSLPNRFEILLRYFYSAAIGLVYSDILLIDGQDRPLGYIDARSLEKRQALRYFFKIGSPCCGGTVMMRHQVFAGGLRYDRALEIGNDNDLLMRIMREWDSVHVPEPLYLYRKHGNNLSRLQAGQDFIHLYKWLAEFGPEALAPELQGTKSVSTNDLARVKALMALFTFRRGMVGDAGAWLKRAAEIAENGDARCFVQGIYYLMTGKFVEATQAFLSCQAKDAIVDNYLGECYAYLGESDKALGCFLTALKKQPDYKEPLENLKGLGGLAGYRLGDPNWRRFFLNNA